MVPKIAVKMLCNIHFYPLNCTTQIKLSIGFIQNVIYNFMCKLLFNFINFNFFLFIFEKEINSFDKCKNFKFFLY